MSKSRSFTFQMLEARQMMAGDVGESIRSAAEVDSKQEVTEEIRSVSTLGDRASKQSQRSLSDMGDRAIADRLTVLTADLMNQSERLGERIAKSVQNISAGAATDDLKLSAADVARIEGMVDEAMEEMAPLLDDFRLFAAEAFGRDIDVLGIIAEVARDDLMDGLTLDIVGVDIVFGNFGPADVSDFTGNDDPFADQIDLYNSIRMDKTGQLSNRGHDGVDAAKTTAGGIGTVGAGVAGVKAAAATAAGVTTGAAIAGFAAAFGGGLAIGTGLDGLFTAWVGKSLGDVIYEATYEDDTTETPTEAATETETAGGTPDESTSESDQGTETTDDRDAGTETQPDSTPAPDDTSGDNPNPDQTINLLANDAFARPIVNARDSLINPAEPDVAISAAELAQAIENFIVQVRGRRNWAIDPGDNPDNTVGQVPVSTDEVVPSKEPVIDPGNPSDRS